MEFSEAYVQVLTDAQRVVSALEAVDPETVTRDNWERKLSDYLDAVEDFEEHEIDIYTAIYDEKSAKGRIREFMRDHVDEAVTSEELARISGISTYTRRLRELREEGFVIDSTRTRSKLGNNSYFMVEIRDVEDKTRISSKARYEQLKQQPTCELCNKDADDSGVRYMEVDHIDEFSASENPDAVNDPSNLQTLCNNCHVGKTASSGVTNDR